MMISIWCNDLFKDRELGDGDEIGLYCDPISANLVFKLLSQVGSWCKGPIIQEQKQNNIMVFSLKAILFLMHIRVVLDIIRI